MAGPYPKKDPPRCLDRCEVLRDKGGKELVIWEESGQSYRCPTALPDGKFAVLRYVSGDETLDGDAYQTLRIFEWDGTVILDIPVSVFDRSMAIVGDTLFIAGNGEISRGGDAMPEAGPPVLSRLDIGGEEIRSVAIQHEYGNIELSQVVYAENSLLVGGSANAAGTDIGVLMRMDLKGGVIWTAEFAPETGSGRNICDVCVSEDGAIAVAWAEYGDFPDDGRLCGVSGLSMDGEALWNHKTGDERVNCILPVRGGVVSCASAKGRIYSIVPLRAAARCCCWMRRET